jgi:hypothetical protein
VVDYYYFLPTDETEASLLTQVEDELTVSLKIYPTACQEALRDLVCSNVYLQCAPDIDLVNEATWNYDLYDNVGIDYPVPFLTPCEDVCYNVTLQCSGLYIMANTLPNCTAQYNYHNYMGFGPIPDQYDLSNDDISISSSGTCFSPTVYSPLAESHEVYVGTACANIVGSGKEIFIPAGNAVTDFTVSAFQGPGDVQSLLDVMAQIRFDKIPAWVPRTCYTKLTEYVCGRLLMHPQEMDMIEVLEQNGLSSAQIAAFTALNAEAAATTIYLPKFADYDLCTSFQEDCAAFITRVDNDLLSPNCSGLVEFNDVGEVRQFPEENVTLASVYVTALGATIDFKSAPGLWEYDETTIEWETSCPEGWVIPDHPNNKHTVWVPSAPCAFGCK